VEEHPDLPYANQAKDSFGRDGKSALDIHQRQQKIAADFAVRLSGTE
jgi:hypothetical protein